MSSTRLFTNREVAELLGISSDALYQRRASGIGAHPPYVKVGHAVLFEAKPLREWFARELGQHINIY